MCALVTSILLLSMLPPVTGDGMPAYHLVDVNDPDHPNLFTSTFESRQLARVDMVSKDQQRVSLFLSVYSLDPGKNLTIMVPLRTLPVNVDGEPMKESEFRKEYLLNRVETEVVEQDMDEAMSRYGEDSSSAMAYAFGSMLLTLPGENMRQRYRLEGDGGRFEDSGTMGGGDEAVVVGPEVVQHYEFDGFSIDVFGVDAGGILENYLADKGLVLPETDAFDEYMGQYVAVVEAEAKPPIEADRFEMLRENAPNTTQRLVDRLRSDPKLDPYERQDLKWDLEDHIYDEHDRDAPGPSHYELISAMYDLVDAVWGYTDFEGEVLKVDLPLDEGKVFFPLGTSAGWPTTVGDIDILFRVPEDKDLSIEDAKDAYFGGYHWYLFQMEQANPGFDLESPVVKGDEARRVEAARADWISGSSEWLSYVTMLAVLLVLWFGFALFLRRGLELEGKVLRDPVLWAMMALSIVVSIPGALLLYLMVRPLPWAEASSRLAVITPVAMYPAALVMLVLAVVL